MVKTLIMAGNLAIRVVILRKLIVTISNLHQGNRIVCSNQRQVLRQEIPKDPRLKVQARQVKEKATENRLAHPSRSHNHDQEYHQLPVNQIRVTEKVNAQVVTLIRPVKDVPLHYLKTEVIRTNQRSVLAKTSKVQIRQNSQQHPKTD